MIGGGSAGIVAARLLKRATSQEHACGGLLVLLERHAAAALLGPLLGAVIDAQGGAQVGATADEFASASIDEATMQIVFDALARSKTSLVKQDDADARIAAWRGADGGFDADAFGDGLRQGAGAVIAANAVLYFFLISGAFIVFKIAVGIAT